MNILLILLSVLLNCAAQLLIRKGMLIEGEVGMQNMLSHVGSMITNLWLWGEQGRSKLRVSIFKCGLRIISSSRLCFFQ